MILTALEMQGFKSFPEKTTLKFGKGITAVVGPNGSGKSNISDAVRWVLGEQSSKSLRGSKMEDVIFDGTRVRKAHGFAQVTLFLDNSDRTIKTVEKDEVAVTRRYYRSGESEYKINGENVRLRDVHELFMDTGLGRDGYSMVSQGKISDMISGKGSECREMFEEAAGISSYRYRRNDSLKKLSQAEENLVRLRDILTELEGRIEPLKHQSQKAEKFLVLADEKKTLEIGIWLSNIERLRDALRKQEDNIAIATGHYDETEKLLKEIEEQIEISISNSQNINIKIDEIRQHISYLEEQALNEEKNAALLKSSIEHNTETIDRILSEKNNSHSSQEQILREIETENKLIGEIKRISAQKNDELKKVVADLDKMQSESGNLADEGSAISGEVALLTKQLSDSRVEQSTAASSIEEIQNRVKIIDSLILQKNQALDDFKNDRKKVQTMLSGCDEKIEELNNSINGYTLRLSAKEEKADKLKRDIDTNAFETQHINSKITMLEDLEKNMEGYSGAVKKVVKAKENNILKGIHGTISKLISVEEQYSLAIETALGNAIQNIITDNEDSAKKAIAYLKDTNSGRATFQPITAVKGRNLDENGLEDCYGYVDKAVSLVKCDEKYKNIISSLLSKIVICEDLTCAISMAKKYDHRFKIVTLDGQVVNAGGSITGGSQTKNAGILSRSAEIERLKDSVSKKETSLKQDRETYEKLCKEIDEISASLEAAKKTFLERQEERVRFEGELKLANEQVIFADNSVKELENEKNSADERINNIKISFDKVSHEVESLSKTIDGKEKRLSLLSEKRNEISQKRQEISENITKLNLDIHGAGKDLTARTQALNLLKARLVSHEDRDKQLDDEITSLKNKNEETQFEILSHLKACEKLRKDSENEKNSITELLKKRNETEEKSSKLRADERNKTAQREKVGGELARLQERKETMEHDYDETVGKLFDEYQLTKREALEIYEIPQDAKASQRRLGEIKGSIRALGSINVGAIEEYKEVKERFEFMSEQIGDVEKSKKELIKLISELTDKMSQQFREQFEKINKHFGETFMELFDGGKAEIILEDPADVLESAIEIKVQPPGKNVKRVDALSGGEKGLSAIALLFAILKVNPAPFCIFDEVEAALDDVNVSRYAQYVRRMTKNTQFILITHRRGTMEEADMLYGITMQEQGVSKLLELKTAELANRLGITG